MSQYILFDQLKSKGFRAEPFPHTLHFKIPGGTSRGVMHDRPGVFISLNNGPREAFGEFGPLQGLSPDWSSDLMSQALPSILAFNRGEKEIFFESIIGKPGLIFAWEMASRGALAEEKGILFDSDFVRGKKGIPMNGLIWMGSRLFQEQQVIEKINQGFSILKFKVGQNDWQTELELLQWVRTIDPKLEIRLDANGAFPVNNALKILEKFSTIGIHSIEQPIATGHLTELAEIIKESPIPIALDEELIGVENKNELLDFLHPKFLILKPMLLGGCDSCEQWIDAAECRNIGWWSTSMLESNIGLEAIAQWVSNFSNHLPQGLGTGQLYENNFDTPLQIRRDQMWHSQD